MKLFEERLWGTLLNQHPCEWYPLHIRHGQTWRWGWEWRGRQVLSPQDCRARFTFLTSWWIFRRHATMRKINYHRIGTNSKSLCLFSYFCYLRTWIVWDCKVHLKKNLHPSWKSHCWEAWLCPFTVQGTESQHNW